MRASSKLLASGVLFLHSLMPGQTSAAPPPQHPGAVDLRFNAGFPMVNPADGGSFYDYRAPQTLTGPDDSLIVISNSGSPRPVLKLDRDGASDRWFTAQITNHVVAACFDERGQLLVLTGDQPLFMRLSTDGSASLTKRFPPETYLRAIEAGPAGSVYVGGSNSKNELLFRLDPEGTLDPTFAPPRTETYGRVEHIAVQSDQRIVIAGSFRSINGVPRNNIARLNSDGSIDTTYNPGVRIASTETPLVFNDLRIDRSDRLHLAGNFSVVENQVRSRHARLLADGRLDRTIPSLEEDAWPVSLSIAANGDMLVAGEKSYRIGDADLVPLPFSSILSIQERSDGGMHVNSYQSGPELYYGSPNWIRIQNYNPSGPNRSIDRIKVFSSGHVAIAGEFSPTPTFPHQRLGILNADGSVLTNITISAPFILDMDVGTNGNVYYAGRSGYNIPATIGRYNIFSGEHKEFLSPNEAGPRTVLVLRDGKLLACGYFDPQAFSTPRILRFDADLNLDPSWDSNLVGFAYSIVEAADGSIIAGGHFSFGNNGEQVVRLHANGTHDTSFNAPLIADVQGDSGGSGHVEKVAIDKDGRVLVSGGFNRVDGGFAKPLIRLKADGSLDLKLPLPTDFYGRVRDVVVDSSGRIFAAGGDKVFAFDFPAWQAPVVTGKMPSGQTSFYAIAAAPDGGIYAAGDFSRVNGIQAPNIVRLWTDNIPLQLRLEVRASANLLTLTGPPGGALVMEVSTNLETWAELSRQESFSGRQTNVFDSDNLPDFGGSAFFRARLNRN